MKKSKPEKKNEPPMRPIEEVYEKMGGKDWPVRECPYYQIGLN